VIRAIVEVLVAEQSAPAFVALALPGFLAATVEATRVPDALIAQRTLPAVVASVTERDGSVVRFNDGCRDPFGIGTRLER